MDREVCPLNLAPTASTAVAMAIGDALAAVASSSHRRSGATPILPLVMVLDLAFSLELLGFSKSGRPSSASLSDVKVLVAGVESGLLPRPLASNEARD